MHSTCIGISVYSQNNFYGDCVFFIVTIISPNLIPFDNIPRSSNFQPMAEEPDQKRQRLEAPESAPILDVNSSARWDFLAPWCDELNGQLISIPSGFIRVLGPRKKLQKPMRFDWLEEEEKEEDKVDPEAERREFERSLWRTREAIELLSLVGKVDRQAFRMLVTERCGLRLPGKRGNDFFVFSDGEEREEEARDEQDGNGEEDGSSAIEAAEVEIEGGQDEARDEEDRDDDVLVLPPDTFKGERQRECVKLVSPRFDFIALSGYGFSYPGGEDAPKSPVKEWQDFLLADASLYQPSDAYKKAKSCLVQMLDGDWSRIPQSLEIPVSLEFNRFAETADQLADYLKELSSFIETMKDRADKVRAESVKPQNATECAQTVTFTLVELSLTMNNRDKMTRLLAERLLGVLESGVHIGELHIYLTGQTDTAAVANHEALAKLWRGMPIRPPRLKQHLPSFSELRIDCDDSGRKKDGSRRKYCWRMVAQTIMRPKSCPASSARSLDLTKVELNPHDLAEITAVLQRDEYQEVIARQWEVRQKQWLLRGNVPVDSIKKEGGKSVVVAGGPFRLPYPSVVELLESSSDWLDVVIPMYGHCRVPRGSVVDLPPTDAARKRGLMNEPLASLSLACSSADGVKGLLMLVGWSLRKVSLSLDREVDVNAIMPTILSACPKLTELTLGDSYIDLDQFAAVYEDMGSSDNASALSHYSFRISTALATGKARTL
jgi:hypothetical protein